MADASIISPTSVTPQSIERDVLAFLKSLPDTDVWQDYFRDASHGRTLIRILAAFGAFLHHQARAIRREANLETARLDSSARAMSYTLGYPMRRRRAARLRLTVPSSLQNTSGVTSSGDNGTIGSISVGGRTFAVSTPTGNRLDGSVNRNSPTAIDCVIGTWSTVVADLSSATSEFPEFAFVPVDADGGELEPSVVDNDLMHIRLNEPGETSSIKHGTFIEDYSFNTREGTDILPALGTIGGDLDAVVKTGISHITVVFGGDIDDALTLGRRPEPNSSVEVKYLICPDIGTDRPELANFVPQGMERNGVAIPADFFRETETDPFLTARPLPADDAALASKLVPGYFASRRSMVSLEDHEAVVKSQQEIWDCKVVQMQCVGYTGDDAEDELFGYDESSCTVDRGVLTEYRSVPSTPDDDNEYSLELKKQIIDEGLLGVYEKESRQVVRRTSGTPNKYEYQLSGDRKLLFNSAQAGIEVDITYDRTLFRKPLSTSIWPRPEVLRQYEFADSDLPSESGAGQADISSIVSVKRGGTTYSAATGAVPAANEYQLVEPTGSTGHVIRFNQSEPDPSSSSPIEIVFRYTAARWQRPPNPSDTNATLARYQTLISYIAVKGSGTNRLPDTKELDSQEERNLLKRLYKHQMLNEQILLKRAKPVDVEVKASVLLTDPDQEEKTRDGILSLIEDQCHTIGGTFDVARLDREINALEGVRRVVLRKPLTNLRLSDLAYHKPGTFEMSTVASIEDLPGYGE